MSGFLDGLPIGSLGPWSLLAIIVLLFALGKIPTLRELRDSQRREERALELAEEWQKIATEHGMTLKTNTETLDSLKGTVEKSVETQQTILHVVRQIQAAGRGGDT